MQKGSALIFLLVGILVITVITAVDGAFYLGRQTTPKPTPSPTIVSQIPQPTPSSLASDGTANWKTYTNPKYPNLKIEYDPSWILNPTEKKSGKGSNISDTFILLKKLGTSLFFDITLAPNPMGGEPYCFSKTEKLYTLVSNNLLRFKDADYGNYYLNGVITKEQNEKEFNEQISGFSNYFNCQKDNSCSFCLLSGNFETTVINTIYPLPNNSVSNGQDRYYGALVKIYVRQKEDDPILLKQADEIVIKSLDVSK